MRPIDADVLKQHIDKLPALPDGNFAGNHSALKALINMQPTIQPEKAQLSKEGATSDLIDRQAAIDALDTAIKHYDEIAEECRKKADIERNDYMDMRDDAYEARQLAQWLNELKYLREKIEQLTIKPEPHWIPVSERLPEDMQYVLLTVRRLNNAYNPRPFISVGYIGWNQHHWWCAHDGDCEISKVEVLAWMPLPEAYKPNK